MLTGRNPNSDDPFEAKTGEGRQNRVESAAGAVAVVSHEDPPGDRWGGIGATFLVDPCLKCAAL